LGFPLPRAETEAVLDDDHTNHGRSRSPRQHQPSAMLLAPTPLLATTVLPPSDGTLILA
jgi:hypothetical protein